MDVEVFQSENGSHWMFEQQSEAGIIPKSHAEKLLKVLESADHHNQRLERMDEQLFGENTY